MSIRTIQKLATYFIAVVWLINGLLCKVLNWVPRHEEIVARILTETYSRPLTILIGLSEIGMAIWILSGIRSRLNAFTQIAIVLAMNVIEFIFASDLLLWGKLNAVFAVLFVLVIYYNEMYLKKNSL